MMVNAAFVVGGLICLTAALLATWPIIRRYSVDQQPVRTLRFAVECLLAMSIIVAAMWASGMLVGWAAWSSW
jgi:hypothetical protein